MGLDHPKLWPSFFVNLGAIGYTTQLEASFKKLEEEYAFAPDKESKTFGS